MWFSKKISDDEWIKLIDTNYFRSIYLTASNHLDSFYSIAEDEVEAAIIEYKNPWYSDVSPTSLYVIQQFKIKCGLDVNQPPYELEPGIIKKPSDFEANLNEMAKCFSQTLNVFPTALDLLNSIKEPTSNEARESRKFLIRCLKDFIESANRGQRFLQNIREKNSEPPASTHVGKMNRFSKLLTYYSNGLGFANFGMNIIRQLTIGVLLSGIHSEANIQVKLRNIITDKTTN